jgi:phosphopantothenoylcysteine decarboxylase / phosphopantothenate---cysteine ligase
MQDKHVVLGVCGGIAAYKAADLTSKLQQAGALVDVVLTEHATAFVTPLTFSSLSHRPVYTNLWEPTGEAAAQHIALGQQADLLVIAPATANTIARLAHGMADDMLATVALTTTAPLLVVPAMEHHMYYHPATQANLRLLEQRGATILPPEEGHLASGAVGMGRFPETTTILAAIRRLLERGSDLAGRRVVVTAGGTREPIDPVRFVGNRSSGLMGFALAESAQARGAEVTLIVGAYTATPPADISLTHAESSREMLDAVLSACKDADALIMAAAVADYAVDMPAAQKIKKGSAAENADGSLTLHLMPNPDILKELAKRPEMRALVRVGFAAETEQLAANATKKLAAKDLDLLVANDVGRSDIGFQVPDNEVTLYSRNGGVETLPRQPKRAIADAIWDRVAPLLRSRSATSRASRR